MTASPMAPLRQAIVDGTIGDCVWIYSNYHCNLACAYCLTESSPTSATRLLPADRIVKLAEQARDLGFSKVGIAGGEPFIVPDMPQTLERVGTILPVVVLTNATLFTERLLERMRPLAPLPVSLQVSLDSADPQANDQFRAPGNFATVTATIPKLIALGLDVRIATTGGTDNPADRARLCSLHQRLGIPDEQHVTRPIVHRGRAVDSQLGVPASENNLPPELTITADGAFWSPFAPTIHGGRVDTDLLLCRTTEPLSRPAEALLALVSGRPPGTDAAIGIR